MGIRFFNDTQMILIFLISRNYKGIIHNNNMIFYKKYRIYVDINHLPNVVFNCKSTENH